MATADESMFAHLSSDEQPVLDQPDGKSGAESENSDTATRDAIAEVLAAEQKDRVAETEEVKAEKAAKAAKAEEDKAAAQKEGEELAKLADKPGEDDEPKVEPKAEGEVPPKVEPEVSAEETKAKQEEAAKAAAAKKVKDGVEESERMVVLREQEKKLRAEQTKAKAEVAAAKTEREKFESEAKAAKAELESIKALLADFERNPESVAKQMVAKGILKSDLGAISKRAMEIRANPNKMVEDELAYMRAETDRKIEAERKRIADETNTREKQRQEQAKQADFNDFTGSINKHIRDNAEKFEVLNAWGWGPKIARELADEFEKTGVMLPVNEYIEHCEAELEKDLKARIAKVKKFGGSTAAAPAAKVASAPTTPAAKVTSTPAPKAPVTPAEEPTDFEDWIKKAGKDVLAELGM